MITGGKPINTIALGAKLNAIAGVQAAPPGYYGGDDNSIIFSYDPDGIILRYRNGCGDCPAGCTYTTVWTFKVFTNTNCNVEYINRIPPADGETAFQRVCSRGVVVMPLSFLSVNGSVRNKIPAISWNIATEENIVRYEIEQSIGDKGFEKVGEVPADGRLVNTKPTHGMEIQR